VEVNRALLIALIEVREITGSEPGMAGDEHDQSTTVEHDQLSRALQVFDEMSHLLLMVQKILQGGSCICLESHVS
jgi:hypothetical protein